MANYRTQNGSASRCRTPNPIDQSILDKIHYPHLNCTFKDIRAKFEKSQHEMAVESDSSDSSAENDEVDEQNYFDQFTSFFSQTKVQR